MSQLDIAKTTTTDLTGTVTDYTVSSQTLDSPGDMQTETWYDFPNSGEYLGYYKTIPELKKAIDALAIWTVGKGVQTEDAETEATLEFLRGWGEDTFQSIMENLVIQKKVFGDAFAEIIRDESGVNILNVKPLYPGDMRVVVDNKGIIKRYEQRVGKGKGKPTVFKPEEILHLSNDRIGNEIHGTSVIEVCKWIIDARNEAMTDYRKVLHRNVVPVRIIEIDTDNTAKRNALITEYQDAIKKGEVLVIPKGTVDIKDAPVSIQNPIEWIRYLENFFYQAVGIPRVIASAEGFSEASSKVGYLTFEPVYTREQTLLEEDIWNQMAYRVKFNRPPSLHGLMEETEEKNVGQVGIEPSEVQVTAGRTE